MRWSYIGTGVSSVALLAMLVYIFITLEPVATPATHPQLTITMAVYDWWWKVNYADDPNPAYDFSTANEIHIPVGEPVRIALKSADVVHAFWVPQLAGKTRTVPAKPTSIGFRPIERASFAGNARSSAAHNMRIWFSK